MRVFDLFLVILWLLLPGPLQTAHASSPEDNASIEFFETKIRPLFEEKCSTCHGQKKQEGGLSLSSRSRAMAGGDSGPIVSPGMPQESLLIRAVNYQTDLKMPPDGQLADTDIADLKRWVQNGAVWPGNEHSNTPDSASAIRETGTPLWSLLPVRDAPLPDVKTQAWPVSPVDFFILAALEHQGGLTKRC